MIAVITNDDNGGHLFPEKPIINITDRPVILNVLTLLEKNNVERILFLSKDKFNNIKEHFCGFSLEFISDVEQIPNNGEEILFINISEIINKNIMTGKNFHLEVGAMISPPVYIGENSYIKEGAQIGPYCVVGENSIVMRNAIIRNSILDKNTVIMDDSFIYNSVIEKDSVIERKSLIKNNIYIGEQRKRKVFYNEDVKSETGDNLRATPHIKSVKVKSKRKGEIYLEIKDNGSKIKIFDEKGEEFFINNEVVKLITDYFNENKSIEEFYMKTDKIYFIKKLTEYLIFNEKYLWELKKH